MQSPPGKVGEEKVQLRINAKNVSTLSSFFGGIDTRIMRNKLKPRKSLPQLIVSKDVAT